MQFDCPEDLQSRHIHIKGSFSYADYNEGKKVYFNINWVKEKGNVISAEFEPSPKIVEFISFIQNTNLMNKVNEMGLDLGYEWAWDKSLYFDILFESSSKIWFYWGIKFYLYLN